MMHLKIECFCVTVTRIYGGKLNFGHAFTKADMLEGLTWSLWLIPVKKICNKQII